MEKRKQPFNEIRKENVKNNWKIIISRKKEEKLGWGGERLTPINENKHLK